MKDLSIHISDRSHLNITLNIYNCGNRSVEVEQFLRPDYYSFYYVKEGRGSITQSKANHKIKAGQCCVIYPNEEATITSEHGKSLNVTWVSFSGYLVDVYLGRAKISPFEPVAEDTPERELEKLFDRLLQAATRPANRYCPIMAQLYTGAVSRARFGRSHKILTQRLTAVYWATPHNCVSGSQRIFCTISAVSKTGNTYSIPTFLKL